MLRMSPSGQKSDLHICQGRACQNSQMLLFLQMGKDQSLPVTGKNILTAGSKKLTAASRLSRFNKQLYFRIMAQRLKMSHTDHRLCNGLFVYNTSCAKFHCHMKAFPDHTFQDFDLNLSH